MISRERVLGLLAHCSLALPGAAFLTLTLGLLASIPARSSPLWPIQELTFSEAAALRDAAVIARLVRAGKDPMMRYPVRRGLLGPETRDMMPVEAAVGAKRLEIVQLLIESGVRIDLTLRSRLVCLAQNRGADDIVEFLRANSPQGWTPAPCDAAPPWE